MKIYNHLTNKKEELDTLVDGIVRMYSCGPTVYNYPHIGNMRAYIFMDSVRRVIKYNGYKIDGVINITDVGHLTSDSDEGDDKMEVTAKSTNKTPQEIAEYYTNIFFEDLNKLNIDFPEHTTKATLYVDKMIEFIKVLEQKGYTYILDDGVYFDITKFKEYGKLSGKDLNDTGIKRVGNDNKHHPFDFALWKFVPENHIMKWNSPWGVGCPGWHIECSVMGIDVLGERIDIHTGGIDHLYIHHENEIAQNNCAMGHQVVNNWMECEFLLIDGGKMSKSLNNFYRLSDLEEMGYDSLDFKYFCLNSHYSKTANFTFQALKSSQIARKNLKKALLIHKNSSDKTDVSVINKFRNEFLEAVNDDINIPLALGILWTLTKEKPSVDIYNLALEFDRVFGLNLDKEDKIIVPKEIEDLANERWTAKQNRDFAKSDELRKVLLDKGYNVLDKKDSFIIEKI